MAYFYGNIFLIPFPVLEFHAYIQNVLIKLNAPSLSFNSSLSSAMLFLLQLHVMNYCYWLLLSPLIMEGCVAKGHVWWQDYQQHRQWPMDKIMSVTHKSEESVWRLRPCVILNRIVFPTFPAHPQCLFYFPFPGRIMLPPAWALLVI